MKRIKTTAANAVKKGLVKVGDEVRVEFKIIRIDFSTGTIDVESDMGIDYSFLLTKISITKPEPIPIDFGKAGLVLETTDGDIVMTTGYDFDDDGTFSAYVLKSKFDCKGYASSNFSKNRNWKDITSTYKPD